MLILACLSLSDGQGKTTTSLLLGRALAISGSKVLITDADPQANLTFYLGHQVAPNKPTLLDVARNSVALVLHWQRASSLWITVNCLKS